MAIKNNLALTLDYIYLFGAAYGRAVARSLFTRSKQLIKANRDQSPTKVCQIVGEIVGEKKSYYDCILQLIDPLIKIDPKGWEQAFQNGMAQTEEEITNAIDCLNNLQPSEDQTLNQTQVIFNTTLYAMKYVESLRPDEKNSSTPLTYLLNFFQEGVKKGSLVTKDRSPKDVFTRNIIIEAKDTSRFAPILEWLEELQSQNHSSQTTAKPPPEQPSVTSRADSPNKDFEGRGLGGGMKN